MIFQMTTSLSFPIRRIPHPKTATQWFAESGICKIYCDLFPQNGIHRRPSEKINDALTSPLWSNQRTTMICRKTVIDFRVCINDGSCTLARFNSSFVLERRGWFGRNLPLLTKCCFLIKQVKGVWKKVCSHFFHETVQEDLNPLLRASEITNDII